MIDLSIVIVSYNTKEFLGRCLDSIFESILKDLEVIVVDNASKDGSVEEIKNLKLKMKNYNSKLKIIENDKNIGFSKANNQGVKIAKGKYLLFLNPDTVVYPETLKFMAEFMDKNGKAGAVTCKVVLQNGKLDDSSHRGFPTPWNAFCYFSGLEKLFPRFKLFAGYHMGWENFTKTHEINACAGSFMLVRREAGDQIKWWDEDYFFYGEDLDFCIKLKEKGWKIYYYPHVSITHYKGVSSGIKKISKEITTADLETKRFATKHRFSAMKILYEKHYQNKYPKIINWMVMLGINFKFWLTLKRI